jgi:DNA-binding NarL/FixJ family response regulator
MATKIIKLVLAEECEIFTYGFQQLISKNAKNEINLISTVSNGSDLLNSIKKYKPNVVVAINDLKGVNTLQACKMIKSKFPKTGILLLTQVNEEHLIIEILNAGANGFISKNASKENMIEAIKEVADGAPYYCKTTSGDLLQHISKSNFKYNLKKQIYFSEQELAIIHMICKQLTTKEIAQSLNLSCRTVEDHRHNIQEKMGVKNVAGLVLFAVHNQLLSKEKFNQYFNL